MSTRGDRDVGTPTVSNSGEHLGLARQLAGLLEGQIHGLASVAEATREQTRVLEQLPDKVQTAVLAGLRDQAREVADKVVASVLLEALQPRPARAETSGARPAPEAPPGAASPAQERLADAKAKALLALAGLLTAAAVGLGGGWLWWGGGAAARPLPPHHAPAPGGGAP